MEGFVDVHSHAVPSGDDGARSIEEAVELCGLALAGGTRVLFATPHAHAGWDHYPLTLERERLFDEAFPVVSRVVSAWGLELRRGFEVFPTVLRDRDPHEFLLEGTRAVLLEFPGSWLDLADDSSLVLEAADRLLAVELAPVIAHPERSIGLEADFGIARALVEQGCLLWRQGCALFGLVADDGGGRRQSPASAEARSTRKRASDSRRSSAAAAHRQRRAVGAPMPAASARTGRRACLSRSRRDWLGWRKKRRSAPLHSWMLG